MSGSRSEEVSWFWVVVGLLIALMLVGGCTYYVAPMVKDAIFPPPTPEPSVYSTFPVPHNRKFECLEKAVTVGDPKTMTYFVSALDALKTSGAYPKELESLDGWAPFWVFDKRQNRLEYWVYGGGDADRLVFEMLPGCFDETGLFIEFAEVAVRFAEEEVTVE